MAASKKPVVRPDWDADSPTLHANLARVDVTIHHLAVGRMPPSVEDARRWHLAMMQGLDPGDPVYVGAFRGEPGLETVGVEVDGAMGTMPWDVEAELQRFEERLALTVSRLDALYPDDASLDDNGRTAVIEVAAWTHPNGFASTRSPTAMAERRACGRT